MSNQNKQDSNYWRSFEELYNNPDVVEAAHHEFQNGVTDDFDLGKLSKLSRRKFLALLSASSALAAAGCSSYRDKGEIIPYVTKPEEIIPGKPVYYSSTCTACENGCGILVKTREGRPIKIDGNPDHPVNKGKICSKGQANILNLYDPQRLTNPIKKGAAGNFIKTTWKNADDEIINALKNAGTKEIALLTGKIISPTGYKVINEFKAKYPSTKIYSYELFNEFNRIEGWKKFGGGSSFPLIKWNDAKIIVSLEADFLGSEGNHLENARMFVEGRDVNNTDKFNRLYVVEGNMSLTGMNADYRIKMRPDLQNELVSVLLKTLSGDSNGLKNFSEKYKLSFGKLNSMLNDLQANRGKSIIYAGRTLPADVHYAVNHINKLLGNDVLYRADSADFTLMPNSTKEDFEALINNMKQGNIAVLINYDSNPIYELPSDYDFLNAQKKVPLTVTLTEKENETSYVSNFVLPLNHDLESWGDIKTRSGFYSFQQPVIYPIFQSRQKESVLLTWLNGDASYYKPDLYRDYFRTNWQNGIFPSIGSLLSFDMFWNGALHDGIVVIDEDNKISNGTGSYQDIYIPNINGYVLILKESYTLGKGRFSGNGWMQELPHPVSKITWDNYAAISLKTAEDLGVKNNDLIDIEFNGKQLRIPVYIQPGCADKTVTIELGYGRENNGTVSENVGFNANIFLTKDKGLSPWLIPSVNVKKAGGSYKLATAQEHHAFDTGIMKDVAQKRKIIIEGTLGQFVKKPNFIQEEKEKEHQSLFPPHTDYQKGVKWAMGIDLNKCLGCGECVISCNAENNIPVVGKDQVEVGREMHWLRIDRYYSGNPDEPNVSMQPMLCQHCDHAPCENVCPVVATTHSPDGLNQMAYNRCVGTRYCSNNCPYKVRRFNFFNFRDHYNEGIQLNPLLNLVYNPEVTVRSRGVMEKCTFCIQRIMEARENSIRDVKPLNGSDVYTACQEACVTNAITFGDMNDQNSAVSKFRQHALAYYVLEDLNIRPNVTYLAKLKNKSQEEA